jgi:hypothetical protein
VHVVWEHTRGMRRSVRYRVHFWGHSLRFDIVPTAHGGFKRAAAVHRDGLELIASATLFDRLLEGLDGTQRLVADRSTPALRAAGGEEFVSVFKKKTPPVPTERSEQDGMCGLSGGVRRLWWQSALSASLCL